MREEHWAVVDAVVRDLVERRADAELAQVSAYLAAHRDADDFFALLDDLASPAGAALARGAQMAQHYAAVRDACQRLRSLPVDELAEAVAWAARLARFEVSQLPPLPRPAPIAARPALAQPTPAGRSPERRGPPPAPGRAPGPRPAAPSRPSPAAPAAARPQGPPRVAQPPPAAGPARPGPAPRPPVAPEGRPPVTPAAQAPAPPREAPRRPPSMEDMLRALQAQYGGGRGAETSASSRQPSRTESRAERLRREQEEIRERYRRQREQDPES